MKSWKISAVVLISLVLAFSAPKAHACGWVDYHMYYNLLDPTLLLSDEYSPLFYTTPNYSNHWINGNYEQDDNIEEWVRFLGLTEISDELKVVVYESSAQELEDALKGRYNGKNRALRSLAATGKNNVLHYLKFAKLCEKYCNIRHYWKEKPDDGGEAALIEQGKKGIAQSTSHFLKLRYAFQTVKLLHHENRLSECVSLYNEVIAPLGHESIISYWALDHKAGALLKLDRRAEGLYLFSRVFAECPSRRYSSFYSFRVQSDGEWRQCLALCNNNEEKATLYFLRAMDPTSVALEEMKNIYRLHPSSPYLHLLTVREINRLEDELLRDALENNYIIIRKNRGTHNYHKLLDYLAALKEFVNMVTAQKTVEHKAFFQICSAYLDFLSYDLKHARNTLNSISTVKSAYRKQINIIHTALSVSELRTIDKNKENEIMVMLMNAYPDNIANHEITQFVLDSMCEIYTKHTPHKYYYTSIYGLMSNPDGAVVQQLLDLAYQKRLTLFQKFLLLRMNACFSGNREFSAELLVHDADFAELKNSLLELKATLLLLDGRVDEAIAIYLALPKNLRTGQDYIDPFSASMHDVIWHYEYKGKTISKLEFAQKLLELHTSLKKDPHNARSHYLLGNAYYNITYFGKSWDLAGYFRSGSYYSGLTDCSRALHHYQKAFEYTKDKELKAECLFLMAKCRQNMFDLTYNTKDYGYGQGYKKWKKYIRENEIWQIEESKHLKGYREYFKVLKDNYSDTEYYEKIIKECKYFRFYASRF
ncbi:MAG: hypothetical protein JW822_06590 [Spirochaetales bacterium]|nr:hypothetical protein [Spirochaetales bacterium]